MRKPIEMLGAVLSFAVITALAAATLFCLFA